MDYLDLGSGLLTLVILVVVVWNFRRVGKKLPEEVGKPILAEAREFYWFGSARMTLYEDFIVVDEMMLRKPRVIRYGAITRVGIARRPLSAKFAALYIEYDGEGGAKGLAQFQCRDCDELLDALAERLDVVGKRDLISWPVVRSAQLTSTD